MKGYITKTCNIVLIPYSALTLQKEHLSVSDESSFIWQSVTKCTAINMRFNYFSRTFWLLRNKISIFLSFIDYHTQYYRKNIRNAAKKHCIYVLIKRNMDIDKPKSTIVYCRKQICITKVVNDRHIFFIY